MPSRRAFTVAPPVDLARTVGIHAAGRGDPTIRLGHGEVWRATRTAAGPATLHLQAAGTSVEATAWGPGADRALHAAPALVGAGDDPSALRPRHDVVASLSRRIRGLRIGRSGAVVEALVPSVLAQKVTGPEAARSFAALVRALGEPAPGPVQGLLVPPAPERLASAPTWLFHRAGVERRRADTVRRACARASRLEEITRMELPDAYRRLLAFPGVGPWTAAEVALRALGDADAVSVGDFHLPHLVSWALAGEPRGTDERMLELLEPYRGQRARVTRLIELGGDHAPRRGPRMPLRSIARL